MNGPKLVTATFSNKPVLTVVKTGRGMVTSSPTGIDCGADCAEPYSQGTPVTLTATPTDATSTFTGWSGGGCSGTSPCVVTMDASKQVAATFVDVPQELSVTIAGNGSGMVTSDPVGINCTAGTCTATYPFGTPVTLTATTTDQNSTFAGWSGDCTGPDPTCTVSMNGPKSVTATFDGPGNP
jgi:hypothetical protein